MNCQKCGAEMESGEERDLFGQMVCEDCYMDHLSPSRTCDPWAVHSAKSFPRTGTADTQLTQLQTRILEILEQTGGAEPAEVARRLNIRPEQLQREVATLRHMEKLRGKMLEDGKRVLVLW
ncbi:MAG: hypothetical protein HY788_10680 [Deltaproteobacteria bacterium]|nr:hypothetical protein [Deltaproteobacteria bacterium]